MKKRFYIFIFVVVIALVSVCGIARYYVVKNSEDHIFDTNEIEKIDGCYTIVLLGASVNPDGSMSPILKERAMATVDLYDSKKACHIIVSGHKSKYYDEVSPIKKYLIENGVPSKIISTDGDGKDTFTSMKNTRDVFKINEALVVTQAFHLSRAVYIGSALGIDTIGYTAYRFPYVHPAEKLKYQLREWPASLKAIWQSEVVSN